MSARVRVVAAGRIVRSLLAFPFLALGAALMVVGVWLHWARQGMRHATANLFAGFDVDRPRPDPMHPFGRCTCAGEGECAWCRAAGRNP